VQLHNSVGDLYREICHATMDDDVGFAWALFGMAGVVCWESLSPKICVYLSCSERWGSRGAASSTALEFVACCCVLLLGGTKLGSSGNRDYVVLTFMRTWSKWPWCMAIDAGGYFHTATDARPGQVVKWPVSIVAHNVDMAGE
jgi:hypothetical protein